MDLTELLKIAYGGSSFAVYGFLNVVVAAAQHLAIVSNKAAFACAAVIGGAVGALGGLIEAQATVGLATTVMMQASIVGGITGAGASTLVGFGVVKALASVYPPSEAKQFAEACRNPMDPTQPSP